MLESSHIDVPEAEQGMDDEIIDMENGPSGQTPSSSYLDPPETVAPRGERYDTPP